MITGLLIVLGIAVLALTVALVRLASQAPALPPPDPALGLMQQQIEGLRQQLSQSLSSNSQQINQRLDNAARLYSELSGQLGQLHQANAQIQGMMKDVSTLQDILRPPKLRGGMGEVLLENLLHEILPPEHVSTQHRFKTGAIVDAVIKFKEGMVCVDAKFPLENFRRMMEAGSEEDRRAARKEFVRNVKKHIDDIHEKYILTDEGTFPFALMYIPAENVYYETIIRDEEADGTKALYSYAISQQVMPVSPNSFYAYLLTLSQGFRGLRIEERAKDIINHLNRLREELTRFGEDFRKVGMHLSNAQTRFVEAEKRLTRFEEKLISAGDHPAQALDPATPSELL